MDGIHVVANLYRCQQGARYLTDAAALRSFCLDSVTRAGLTSLGDLFHSFDGGGVTGAVVLAESHHIARRAAKRARIEFDVLPAILTIEDAMAANSFIMPPKGIQRGDASAAIASAPHRVKGSVRTGQQEQFYLEGQITYAVPREDGQLTLYCSTQHPDGNQREAAAALNLSTSDVEVICRRMGGGFGGKEGNASIFSQSAALAAFKLKRPVKLRVNRDDDMTITGKRHDFRIDYEVGFDDAGRIHGIDLVLAAAGHAEFGPVAEWDPARLSRMLEVHIGGTFHVCKHALPVMKRRGQGSIVTIASTAAFTANGNNVPYGAAKAGITGLTRQLSLEALPEVRINCIAPGRTITGMTTPLMLQRGGDMEQGEKIFGAKIPMQRMGTAAELAAAVCFFLSNDASFITGQTLIVDGGETIS